MIGTSTSTKVKISNILDSQILDFIQEENPDFKDFLNQYYISEEHEFGSTYLSDNLASLKNIGDTSNNILNVNINNKLTSDINAFDDEIFVTTTNGYPDQYGLFKIDNEIITYTGKTSTSFTGCIRGFSSISSIEKSEYLTFSVTDSEEHLTDSQVLNLSTIFVNEFYRKHKSQFLPGFEGRNFVEQVNIENILTRAKDFYRSKGTDTSLEILFKVLFGKSVVIEKPFENTIGSSDSEWVVTDNMIVDVLEGDPFKLISTKIFQGEFNNPTAEGTISNIQEVFLGPKKYYKLSFDKSAHFGSFNVGVKTKVTQKAPDNSSTINVDSTVGFENEGTFIYRYRQNTLQEELLVASYTSKSENQFFGCTGIVDEGLKENSDIINDTLIFGYEDGDPEKICTMRITGTVSKPSENASIAKYASVGETIKVNYLGEKATGSKFDTWLYNHPSTLDIAGVFNNDTDEFTNIIVTKDPNNFLYKGCKVDIIRYDWAGSTEPESLKYVPTSVSIDPEAVGFGYTAASNVPTTGGSGKDLTVDITVSDSKVNGVTINNAGLDYVVGDLITIIGGTTEDAIIRVDKIAPIGFGKITPTDPGFGAFSIIDEDVLIDKINKSNGHITLAKGDKANFIDRFRPHKIIKKLSYTDSSLDELSPDLLNNIQNTYIDDVGNTYVSFSGYPSYPIQTTNRSVKIDNFQSSDQIFITDSAHSFISGEKVFFEQNAIEIAGITTETISGSGITTEFMSITSPGKGVIDIQKKSLQGEYYVSFVGSNEFKLAVTLEQLNKGNFVKFNLPGISTTVTQIDGELATIITTTEITGVSTCTITPSSLAGNKLSNQNNFKRILKTPEVRESENKIIGPVGVQLNGVEIYSPVLQDFICYGQIDDVVVTNKGKNYDVVSPPNVSITSDNGSGAKLHGHFSGNISEIVVTHPGFNYADTPQVLITGGNISASNKSLVGEAHMRGFIHSFSFNDISNFITRIDLDNDSVIHGDDKPHKFENGEEVVYTTTGTPIGIGSTPSTNGVGFNLSLIHI